ncbi:hypothetical protein CIHG_09521 [Coccidioides immitis H538.4]|uniref:14-3-3 domain-containing protein n=1 Tax=Coccidioides immitis H538.4 TaxID=396776 RepID=A0A0J8S5U5_COCIT|nr:hypothetical protein CIHG_09521 [Coccidioides immitis H538.4]
MDAPSIENLIHNPNHMPELIHLSYQWQDSAEPPAFATWMASSEVDQKFLGHFATATSHTNPFLSGMLYKILGLSVVLSKKLLRARKLRRLDPTRETKSLHLYHHILWLSREGLIMVGQYILPMVTDYVDLEVLSYKLQASFYHILSFSQQPRIHILDSHLFFSTSHIDLRWSRNVDRVIQQPARFILCSPTNSFQALTPIRLSVKLEYAAYLYDCLNDAAACRRLAKQAIADVYNAQEGMDDESFEDAAELVGILGKMVKRGGKTSSGGTSSVAGGDKSWSDGTQSTPTRVGASGENTPQLWQKRTPTSLSGVSPIVNDPIMGQPI